MLSRIFLLAAIALRVSNAEDALPSSSTSTSANSITTLTGTRTNTLLTPTYSTFASTAIGSLNGSVPTAAPSENSSNSIPADYSTTATAPPGPTNTQPCNNYVEFCERKYSNVTVVGCHNSPFVRTGSAAANQALKVEDQLDDGIRFLQAQIQWPDNDTEPHFCHTSCDILDAGPITPWLRGVADWVAVHPFDVVTVLLGNGNRSTPDHYVPYIESSGLLKYVYTPPAHPMARADWPPLSEMILRGQRVVLFLDYMANQTAYPWLLDEFAYFWETPFSPVDPSFPCTVDRPPNLPAPDAETRLYLMNHNLNVNVTLLDKWYLVPAVSLRNTTNNASGPGSLGMAAESCRSAWNGLSPNVLNVDYYNFGGKPGSVFEAAARINNVSYDRPCCGLLRNTAVPLTGSMTTRLLVVALSWAMMRIVVSSG